MSTVEEIIPRWESIADRFVNVTLNEQVAQTSDFFRDLDPAVALKLVLQEHEKFRNRNGVPFAYRYAANIVAMQADLATLDYKKNRTEKEENLRTVLESLLADQNRRFAYYQRDRGFAEVKGAEPSEADSIAYLIPGMKFGHGSI
jgi:hypothetical protein